MANVSIIRVNFSKKKKLKKIKTWSFVFVDLGSKINFIIENPTFSLPSSFILDVVKIVAIFFLETNSNPTLEATTCFI